MATVDKNFKVKHGLIVEGTTATVNGEDIITTGNTTDSLAEGTTNKYFTDQRAINAVGAEISSQVTTAINALTTDDIEEGTTNKYFTDSRALTATASAYDAAGSASTVASDLSTHISDTSTHGVTGDIVGTSDAQSLSNKTFVGQTNFQSGGGAGGSNNYINVDNSTGHMTVRSGYELELESQNDVNIISNNGNIILNADNIVYLDSVYAGNEVVPKSYIDGLASNYDAAGAASTAETNANTYTNTALGSYTTTANLDTTVGGYGYIKTADLSGLATETYVNSQGFITSSALSGLASETYVNTAVNNLVDGAPGLLDTLNEIAAAIADDANYATTMTTALAGKQNELTAGTNISIVSDTISVTGLVSTDISDFSTAALSATASAYDAAGAAATAEAAANTYADNTFVTLTSLPGQLDDYVPTTEKGQALGVATLDSSGYVPASQLGNVPASYVTALASGESNLSVVNGDLALTGTPSFTSVSVNSVAKQVAATASVTGSTSNSVYSFRVSDYKSAKFLVKVTVGSDVEVSEILLVADISGNIAITEYGNVASNASLSSITASYVGGSFVSIDVTPTGNGTVKVFGTLIA